MIHHTLKPEDIRKCKVCGVAVGHMVPASKGSTLLAFYRYPNCGQSDTGYVCLEHSDD